jgi:hypothetical protein
MYHLKTCFAPNDQPEMGDWPCHLASSKACPPPTRKLKSTSPDVSFTPDN